MNRSTVVTILSVLAFVLAGAGLYLLNRDTVDEPVNKTTATTNETQQESTVQPSSDTIDTKLTIGNPEAQVSVVEYADYKCPNCNRFSRTTETELFEKYSDDQLNIEVRQTPIIGPDSANAARGAYCANDQGIFEKYHQNVLNFMWDNYYSSSNFAAEFETILTTDKLAELIANEDINTEEFKSCVNSDKYNPALDRDLLAAADDGVRGTPGFAIGGQSFVGLQPLSVFSALIDSQL